MTSIHSFQKFLSFQFNLNPTTIPMTKKIIGFASVLAVGSVPVLAINDIEPSKEKYTAPFTVTPITLDGKLNEWGGVSQIVDPKFAIPKGSGKNANPNYVLFEEYAGGTWTGPSDHTSAVQVAYDADNVYFGFVVTDEYHENAANSAWNGDSVQLMIANAGRTQQVALYNYALGGTDGALGEVIVQHEAGPGETEAIVTRDTNAKKTYYEIKLPASSLGLTKLTPGTKFGLGMAINDGDELTPGQKGWGGLGAHAIVFGKTPGETAEVTLGADKPTIEILGVGAESLLGKDLTDPEDDGDESAGPTSPTWNWASINSNSEPGFEGGEFSFNIFDNKVGGGNDKWCCEDPTTAKPLWVAVQFKNPVKLTHFTITSGNDAADRRPTQWQIQGSNDGANYTPIYVFDNPVPIWTEHNQVAKITLATPAAPFRYLRYYVIHTPGTLHQINEIEYFGTFGEGGVGFFSAVGQGIDTFTARANDSGSSVIDPASIKLTVNGQNVNLGTLTKRDGAVDIVHKFAKPFPSGVVQNYVLTAKDNNGNVLISEGPFTLSYVSLAASLKAAPNTSKPGFLWRVFQNQADTRNSNVKSEEAIAGKLKAADGTPLPNKANPDATGTALAAGKKLSNADNALIEFEIPTVINFDQAGGSNGAFTPDDQMPGIPSIEDNTDGIVAEIISWIELPQGLITMGVNSDDGFLTSAGSLNDVLIRKNLGEFNGGRGASDTIFSFFVEEAGVYPFRTTWQEGGGGANIEWFTVKDGVKSLINDTANGGLKAYRAGAGGGALPTAITSLTPFPGNSATDPGTSIEVEITEGATTVDTASVKLTLDGAPIAATVAKNGKVVTAKFQPAPLPPASKHKVGISFTHGGATRNAEYEFAVPPLSKDKVGGIAALLTGSSKWTADKGGFTGAAGDYGMDLGPGGASLLVNNAAFFNTATADDAVTVSVWQKRYDVSNGSIFWFNSPTSSGSTRGFQAHAPWGDNTIYFDTAGCCDGSTQRISKNISELPTFTAGDNTWWNQWRHYVFLKNADVKQVWIDGELFLEGNNTGVLPTDFNSIVIGGGPAVNQNLTRGLLDDFAVYNGALNEANIKRLAGKAAPSSVTGLLAHWDFNDPLVPKEDVTLAVVRDGGNVKVTSTPAALPAGWVLQTAPSVTGPWTTQAGTKTPFTAPIGSGTIFLRAIKP